MPLQISSEKLLDDTEIKLAQIKLQYSGFVVFTTTRLIEEEIIDEIHRKMEAANISKKVIQTTFLDKKVIAEGIRAKHVLFFVRSTYISDTGFPVAVFIEKGRKAYDVKALYKKALSWIDKLGTRIFAEKVHIPKYVGKKFIEDTIREKRPAVQRRLDEETKKWIDSILKA